MGKLDLLENELKLLIVDTLMLEDVTAADIGLETPLFNDGLGLDSIDALELGMAISKKYHVKLSQDPEENKKYFTNVQTLARFIAQKTRQMQECSS